MNKRGWEISFAWLFALIVGAFILFLAIFASVKIIHVGQTEVDAKTGKEFGILLNPLETGFESAKSTSITMPVETRFLNGCELYGDFGQQKIQISQKNFNKWTETNLAVSFPNKYIFSERIVQGQKYLLFSKPFEFPYKVADIITMTSADEDYCFLNAPENIVDEISLIGQENFYLEDCPTKSVKVCFDSGLSLGECDIKVDYNNGYVTKDGKRLYFENDALMYAAIFSGKDVYECQLKRLMKRTKNLALVYSDKADFVAGVGCNTNVDVGLLALINAADNLDESANLAFAKKIADDVGELNDVALCKLW